MSKLNNPLVINFETKDLGNEEHGIFKTTVTTIEELVNIKDNTPVIEAQIRALSTALEKLKERVLT
jgi:hypothetical protein